MIGTYGKTMSEQKAQNDTWYDCRGASNWFNPLCWGPTGSVKRTGEDAYDAYYASQSSNGEGKKDKKGGGGSGGSGGGGGLAPYRSGGIKAGGIAGIVMGVLGLGLIAFILFGKKKGGRKT